MVVRDEELDSLRRACAAQVSIPEVEWSFLAARVARWGVPRGEPLLRQGERVDWLAFLAKGLVRLAHSSPAREVTLGFDCEERFVGAYDAFRQRTPAAFAIEALEPCVLFRFDRDLIEELEARHDCWRELGRRIVERSLLNKIDKELRIRTQSAQERYAELVRRRSFLVRRVPQYHLASFLGIAPETLSRIRARIGAVPRS